MNIGYLLDCASRNAGGLFESVRRLSQSFRQERGATFVFSIADEHAAEDSVRWQPLELRLFDPKWMPAWGYSPELTTALVDAELEILMTHGLWKYNSAASHAWHRQTGRPYIIHPHGMLDPWALRNSGWKKKIAGVLYENAHLRDAACIRALCESEAESIRACGLRNPICIIPNGIDLPSAASGSEVPDPYAPLSLGRKVLLYLGRLHPKKNLSPLLQAWAQIQRESATAKDWVLAIAGWDQNGYETQLQKQCSDLGLALDGRTVCAVKESHEANVLFLGPLFGEAKAAAYRNASGFVLPSLSEGLPMVVLEAWAFEKPVLMTPECNLPEGFAAGAALRIGTTADEIAPGLRSLIEMSDVQRSNVGARGRELVQAQFTWEKIGMQMREVCDWAVKGGSPPLCVRLN